MANPFLRLLGAKKSPAPVATPPPLPDTDPVRRLVTALIDARTGGASHRIRADFDKTDEGRALLALTPEDQARAVDVVAQRARDMDLPVEAFRGADAESVLARTAMNRHWSATWDLRSVLAATVTMLLRRSLPLSAFALRELVAWAASRRRSYSEMMPTAQLTRALVDGWTEHGQDPELRRRVADLLERLRPESEGQPPLRRHVEQLEALLGLARRLPIVAGETWADAALAQVQQLEPGNAVCAAALLDLAYEATSSAPTAKWLKRAEALTGEDPGRGLLREFALTWFPLVDKPAAADAPREGRYGAQAHPLSLRDANQDVLKGLAWMCGLQADAELARAVARLCLSALKKLPGVGPRAPRLANACIWALGRMPQSAGLGQLALLKIRIRFGTSLKAVDKALAAVAAEAGVTPEELEEMAVPAYGMETVGVREETFGDFTARLEITGTTSTLITWRKADGKVQKSVPAVVKEQFAEDWKELKTAAADIEKMLPAQRDRIDNLYLQQRSWAFPVWRERYLDHPLTGTLARRLIWTIVDGGSRIDVCWHDGALRDCRGHAVPDPAASARVELWHPIGHATGDVLGWRNWLEEILVQQPFKQAHREVYLLTDAELATGVYSNRFAAHIIKQHQFNALCGVRGWKNKLRLMVDADYPPATRLLPTWDLRAEFWIESIGDAFGTDTNDAGVFLRLATDQVRFYRQDAPQRTAHAGGGGYHPPYRVADGDPVPLREIPPLVLSEILRDVDLFVGVSSVGNDPTWADGGPDGRHRDYWQDYSFGSLNETAKTRRDVLQRLLPRLKIAGVCELGERFLVVRGKLRTYKIHLGSGNILMLPNDQYLCIVPKSADEDQPDRVALPFEGDRTLSIILSKAFLLAADDHIKDETITRQIGRPAPG